MREKYSLEEMLAEIEKDKKSDSPKSKLVSQDDIQKLMAQKRKQKKETN